MFRLPTAIRVHLWTKLLAAISLRSPGRVPTLLSRISSYPRQEAHQRLYYSAAEESGITVPSEDPIPSAEETIPISSNSIQTAPTQSEKTLRAVKAALEGQEDANGLVKAGILERAGRMLSSRGDRRRLRPMPREALAAGEPLQALSKVLDKHSETGEESVATRKAMQQDSENGSDSGPASFLKPTGSGASGAQQLHPTSTQRGPREPHANPQKQNTDASRSDLMDVTYMRNNFSLPTKDDYPGANQRLFHPASIGDELRNFARNNKTKLDVKANFQVVSKQGSGLAAKLTPDIWVCKLDIDVPGHFKEDAVGEGIAKSKAQQAAWLHTISKLHAKKVFSNLFKAPIRDISFFQRLLPSKEQYPHAPSAIFDSLQASNAINSACQKLSGAENIEWEHTEGADGRRVSELRLEVPNHLSVTADGEGQNTKLSKRAAWLHMITKMHDNGFLHRLFPDPATPMDESVAVPSLDTNALPAYTIDAHTLQIEKDAKMDIYNYAASLGLVPLYEAVRVTPPTPKGRQGRLQKKPKPLVKVSVRLQETGLEAAGFGKTLHKAEVIASLSLKRIVEKQHSTTESKAWDVLNLDTATQFFVFHKKIYPSIRLETEHEEINVAGFGQHAIYITMNGETVGQTVTMAAKKAAMDVAYLTAAIQVVHQEPSLLPRFTELLRKGKGKILRDIPAIGVDIDIRTLEHMRVGLVEARMAGLPDIRETLPASNTLSESRIRNKSVPEAVRRAASAELLEQRQQLASRSPPSEISSQRASLPMTQYSKQVVDQVSKNVYSIIVGATGSGKTTQVPQILLADAIDRGEGGFCDIVCTQPRRIAASSVAKRVAAERSERVGGTVGYQVRFEARLPRPGGSITYCTTGILLEQLKHDPDSVLDNVSHLVLDEVHERDQTIDFLLIILKRAIKSRVAAGKTVPKVVFMSATLDTKLFADYFSNGEAGVKVPCPTLSVPGRTFPVKEVYLGELMGDLEQSRKQELSSLIRSDPKCSEYVLAEQALARNSTQTSQSTSGEIDWKRDRNLFADDAQTQSAAEERSEAIVPVPLLAATIAHICSTTDAGAILAFLPGLAEILSTRFLLRQQPIFGVDFSSPERFRIHLLHSTVPPEEQQEIFEELPAGCRRIILSTNIAETSVTVPDVRYVVDTGKLRESRYDQLSRTSKLQCVWVSKSNAKQRAGRAGRVQEGHYYALYSRERRETMRAANLPELLRIELTETCLSIKAQGFKEPVVTFLQSAIEAPSEKAVISAIDDLKAMQALTEDEELTAFGRVLSRLPVHPTLAKMIILGIVFRCLDSMIILGAMGDARSLLLTPIEQRQAARSAHATLGDDKSDQLAVLKAFKELREVRDRRGQYAATAHAHARFIHFGAFSSIERAAKDIEVALLESRLIPTPTSSLARFARYGGDTLNVNSDNAELIKCLILAGVYPNLAVQHRGKRLGHRTATENFVMQHPGSQNATRPGDKPYEKRSDHPQIYAYSSLAKRADGASLFMRDSTLVSPLMAMLFGGRLRTDNWRRLEMDDWVPFTIFAGDSKYAARMIMEYRKGIDRMLHGVYQSLSGVDRTLLAEDPLRENFVRRLVQMLDHASGKNLQQAVPQTWRTGRGDR